jgi:hypothetical protein
MLFLGAVTVQRACLLSSLCVGRYESQQQHTNMSPIRDSGTLLSKFPTIDETPRFGSPEFMEELRTVVGVDPLPGTPQLGFEWMASDDLSCGITKASQERLKQRYALVVFTLLQDAGTRGVAGPLLPVLANMNATGPGVYCDRDNAVVPPTGYVCWNFAGSIPSDIFFHSWCVHEV